MCCYWKWLVKKVVFRFVLFLFTDDKQLLTDATILTKAVTVKTPPCFPYIEDDEKALNPCRQRLARLDLHRTIAGADKTEEKHFENDWLYNPFLFTCFKEMNNNNSI